MTTPAQEPAALSNRVSDEDLASALEQALTSRNNPSLQEKPPKPETAKAEVSAEKTELAPEEKKGTLGETVKVGEVETTETEGEIESTPPISEEHKENSKLGRKLKGLSDQVANLQAVIAKLTTGPQTPPVSQETDAERIEAPELVTTPDDVIQTLLANPEVFAKLTAVTEAKKQEDSTRYQQGFIDRFREVGKAYPELQADLETKLLNSKELNKRLSNDPQKDAELLYHKTLAAYLIEKSAAPSSGVPARKTGKPPAGPAAKETSASSEAAKPSIPKNLDENSKSLVSYMLRRGKTEAEIASMFA